MGARMNYNHFVRIERRERKGSRFFVVHSHEPKLYMELTPEEDAEGRTVKGTIKRIVIPNSWTGNYQRYGQLLSAAQTFFEESLALNRRPGRG